MIKNAMNGTVDGDKSNDSLIHWSLGLVFLSAFVATLYFADIAWYWRLLLWVILLPVGGFAFLSTQEGKSFRVYLKEVRVEFDKIVWPSREETTRSTMMVMALIVAMGVLIWLADNLFMWFIRFISG